MILELQSFYLAPIEEKDAWALCNFMVTNEDRLKRYLPQTLAQNLTPDLSHIFAVKKEKQYRETEVLLFLLKKKETNVLAGLIYIKNFDWETKEAEFAYCIGYEFKGKGLIAKAVKELSSYVFTNLGLKSLIIITHKTNKASVAVAEQNDFRWQKTLKNEFTPSGEKPVDMELYRLYKETNSNENALHKN
ncbi:GNAT family N-acetyltransferase [Cellulophaga sp. F20128]|uniref:GNAT family N-acetyltransferase n=1 Tax=Cellulophaga sp. F20128 TaxID=2926413 RepID=UPI001FF3D3B4|nr:GNAT family protein [Cellulophaga sp. F20128]MCK0155885.1 GNAT family N-acetyltransferase [Cellulophaga sp. F20128]